MKKGSCILFIINNPPKRIKWQEHLKKYFWLLEHFVLIFSSDSTMHELCLVTVSIQLDSSFSHSYEFCLWKAHWNIFEAFYCCSSVINWSQSWQMILSLIYLFCFMSDWEYYSLFHLPIQNNWKIVFSPG